MDINKGIRFTDEFKRDAVEQVEWRTITLPGDPGPCTLGEQQLEQRPAGPMNKWRWQRKKKSGPRRKPFWSTVSQRRRGSTTKKNRATRRSPDWNRRCRPAATVPKWRRCRLIFLPSGSCESKAPSRNKIFNMITKK